MAANEHKQCYGRMFPSVLHAEAGKPISGKAFVYRLENAGGTFISGREVSVRMEQWDDCSECAEFERCYKLSMARLALESSVARM